MTYVTTSRTALPSPDSDPKCLNERFGIDDSGTIGGQTYDPAAGTSVAYSAMKPLFGHFGSFSFPFGHRNTRSGRRGLFISYRRKVSAGWVGRLARDLGLNFREESIFYDLRSIKPGSDFSAAIYETIANSSCALVVIGPDWLDVVDDQGQRRLNNPDDYVRLEVSAILRQGIRVIPVLVGEAKMPSQDLLPEDLKPLALRQAIELRDARWDDDVKYLERYLFGRRYDWWIFRRLPLQWLAIIIMVLGASVLANPRASSYISHGYWQFLNLLNPLVGEWQATEPGTFRADFGGLPFARYRVELSDVAASIGIPARTEASGNARALMTERDLNGKFPPIPANMHHFSVSRSRIYLPFIGIEFTGSDKNQPHSTASFTGKFANGCTLPMVNILIQRCSVLRGIFSVRRNDGSGPTLEWTVSVPLTLSK